MRISLEPLLTVIPIVGAASITLLQAPDVNFNLEGIGAVANLPGIKNLINKVSLLYIHEHFLTHF